MSGVKSSGLLLILSVPFALYIAWQVQSVARSGLLSASVPADKGATPESLATARTKATTHATEARKAVAVSWQYRAANTEDASNDPVVTGVTRAATARAADLTDLDKFLSGIEKPEFTSKLKPRYDEWMVGQAKLRTDAQAVTDWLARPLKITSVPEAEKAVTELTTLTNQYIARSRFADKSKATLWRLRGRLAVIDSLTTLADSQYQTAIRVKLPLDVNAGTTAVSTLRALREQIAALRAELKQADEDRITLDATFRATIEDKGLVADDFAAREELLSLFAKPDLFTNATGATAWLKLVVAQFAKTKDEKVRGLIREKVQEFCDAFIPLVVDLDDDVLLRGKPEPRKGILISFEPTLGAKAISKPLVRSADGFNEFEIAKKAPGFNALVRAGGGEYELATLKPTPLSKLAVAYNLERKKLSDVTAPRWTPKSLEELKMMCEMQKELVDQLKVPGEPKKDAKTEPETEQKIATRLLGLAAGMNACKELFETGR
jgi:hypothetical protein